MPAAKGDLELLTAMVSGFKNFTRRTKFKGLRGMANLKARARSRTQRLARRFKFNDRAVAL